LTRRWFLTGDAGFTDAVAFYDDVTVTLRPAGGPGERSFTLSTSGFRKP